MASEGQFCIDCGGAGDVIEKACAQARLEERQRIVDFLRDPAHPERGGALVGEILDRLAGIIEGLEVSDAQE
tara:strand:- start:294 stop:509 length:216 start_codon:yes stop_codon:yes gene_type:complete